MKTNEAAIFYKSNAQILFKEHVLSTAECNNRLPCSARLVYSSQYNDQKVRHVVYSAQYVIFKRK